MSRQENEQAAHTLSEQLGLDVRAFAAPQLGYAYYIVLPEKQAKLAGAIEGVLRFLTGRQDEKQITTHELEIAGNRHPCVLLNPECVSKRCFLKKAEGKFSWPETEEVKAVLAHTITLAKMYHDITPEQLMGAAQAVKEAFAETPAKDSFAFQRYVRRASEEDPSRGADALKQYAAQGMGWLNGEKHTSHPSPMHSESLPSLRQKAKQNEPPKPSSPPTP